MFEPYNPYNMYNPYYNNYNYNQQSQIPRQNQNQNNYKLQNQIGLQGKIVDSLDVVKATDIPYDGSVSYFPLTDNSAIITKQLQPDGTSKVVVYKPEIGDTKAQPKYVTESQLLEQLQLLKNNDNKYITETQLNEQLKNINNKDLKDMKEELKILKRKLEDITDDIKDKKEK